MKYDTTKQNTYKKTETNWGTCPEPRPESVGRFLRNSALACAAVFGTWGAIDYAGSLYEKHMKSPQHNEPAKQYAPKQAAPHASISDIVRN